MISKKGYISGLSLVGEWLTNNGFTGKVEEDIARRWIDVRAEEIIGTEQLSFGVGILDIVNHQASLPEGLHSIYVAAVVDDHTHAWNKESLVGFTEKVYGTDCDVKVELLCPQCHEASCSHRKASFDVQVDNLYLQSRPYLWAMTSTGYLGHAAATTDGFPTPSGHAQFELMKPRSTESALWNSDYWLGLCNGLGHDCYKYDIEPPYFNTDLKEGQVFISFLRYLKDEDGYYLIPNYPIVVRAITAYMDEMMMWRLYLNGGNQTDRLRWHDAQIAANQLKNEATSQIETPSPDKWMDILKKNWVIDRGRYHYGRPTLPHKR